MTRPFVPHNTFSPSSLPSLQRRTDSLAQKAEEERLLLEAEEAEKARETQAREEKKERELEDLKVGAASSHAGEGQLPVMGMEVVGITLRARGRAT